MQKLLPWLLNLVIAATHVVQAAPVAPPRLTSPLTVSFVPIDTATRTIGTGDAIVDFGAVSANHGGGRVRELVVRRRVAVHIDSRVGAITSARLSVALASDMSGSRVRVDGVTLSTIPRLISPVHPVGTAVVHEIEITIPATVPPGTFHNDLQWSVESD